MKRTIFAAAAGLLVAGSAWSQPYGMGPGMMGGYGGPGMMGGYEEGYGMGPGMMRGYGGGYAARLNLTDEQRTKIAGIEDELAQKRWGLMTGMHQQRYQSFKEGKADDATLRKSFEAMQATQKQMFEAGLDASKRIEAVLTPEQRKQLPRGAGRFGMMGMMW